MSRYTVAASALYTLGLCFASYQIRLGLEKQGDGIHSGLEKHGAGMERGLKGLMSTAGSGTDHPAAG